MRRWREGQEFDFDGLRFRVCRGKKAPADLRLDVMTGGTWRAVHMRLGAMLADFFYENEDVLYPPPAKGGRKYLDYCRDAAKHGWEKAEAVLRIERRQKSLFDEEDEGGEAA